jgi:hypothetical protein
LREEERRGPLQQALIALALRVFARRSRLLAGLQAANTGFLSGIPTYVLKLGPANLVPPYDGRIDREVVKSPLVAGMRIRLHQVAGLLADALAPRLAADPAAPLHLVEIAGGPSADALNALILLNAGGLLGQRAVRITIYDIDSDGPAFAAAMLAALQAGPLAGRDIAIAHVPGNWSDTAALARLLADIPPAAILAATSEGGLFEYGSDTDISGCLEALAPRVPIVTGSVTRNDRLNQLIRRHSGARVVMRGLERFAAIVAPTGYAIARSRPSPLSDQVLLTRAPAA